jgi:hypothetical protein
VIAMSELRNRPEGTASAPWPTIGAPPARPPMLEGPLRGLVPVPLFLASLLALPGLLVSATLGGGVALGSLVMSVLMLLLSRRTSGRGLLIAAVCLGSVGVVLAVLILLMAPATWVTTVTVN